MDVSLSMRKHILTDGGEHVGSLQGENALWSLCALGGAWDCQGVVRWTAIQYALSLCGEDLSQQNEVPKPQQEAEQLLDNLCDMTAPELAGYVSSLCIDFSRRTDSALGAFQKLTYSQQRAVQGALLSLERLSEVQRALGLDDAVARCQLEIGSADVVTAWASGCSWDEALVISGAQPGDLVRTLSRVRDALRQIANVPFIPARGLDGQLRSEACGVHPKIRSLCKEAGIAMDRYPVKDMLPFQEIEPVTND